MPITKSQLQKGFSYRVTKDNPNSADLKTGDSVLFANQHRRDCGMFIDILNRTWAINFEDIEPDVPEDMDMTIDNLTSVRNDLLARANKLTGIIKKRKNEVTEWEPKKTDIVWYVDSLNDVQSNKSDYLVDRVQRFRTESEAKSEAMRRESMKRGRMPKLGEVVYSWFMNCDRPDDFKFKWENEAEQIEEYYLGRTFKTKEECLEHCKKYSKFWGEI